jgi:hypothetical protein
MTSLKIGQIWFEQRKLTSGINTRLVVIRGDTQHAYSGWWYGSTDWYQHYVSPGRNPGWPVRLIRELADGCCSLQTNNGEQIMFLLWSPE